jgi:hypothetical protein
MGGPRHRSTVPAVRVVPNPRPPVRCRQCGDVIGIYEPLVLLTATGGRETSLAAEPELSDAPSPVYHRACTTHSAHNR